MCFYFGVYFEQAGIPRAAGVTRGRDGTSYLDGSKSMRSPSLVPMGPMF
jgi:hypothetical protein